MFEEMIEDLKRDRNIPEGFGGVPPEGTQWTSVEIGGMSSGFRSGAREISPPCQHEFPDTEDFCTHLGHETLGAHTRHFVCRLCGALKSVGTGEDGVMQVRLQSAAAAMQNIHFWTLIKRPHRCVSGWRGRIVFDEPSNIRDTYH